MTDTITSSRPPAPKKNRIDPLEGPLLGKIIRFAIPLALSSILQQLCNSIDVAIVGKFASSEALAAVGTNGPVIGLMVNLFIGISIGANVVIARYIGQKNTQGIRDAVSTVGLLSFVSGFFLMILGQIIARPILILLDTPDNILDLSVLYLRIFFLGMPFMVFYNFGSAILRSMGDSNRPLYCLIAAGIVNTVLNLILVIGFNMSVEGVAIATVISFIVSSGLILLILMKEVEPFRMHLGNVYIAGKELRDILRIGIPTGIQGVIFSIANLFIQAAINRFGSDAIAGSATALNYELYSYFVICAFTGAAVTFIGQNFGAKNIDRCKRVFWLSLFLASGTLFAMGSTFVWQQEFFISLFTSDAVVSEFAGQRMSLLLMTQFLSAFFEVPGAALRGLGKSTLPTIITVFGTCLLRLLWIYCVCPYYPSFEMLLMIYPISWIVTGIMMFAAYHYASKKLYLQISAYSS